MFVITDGSPNEPTRRHRDGFAEHLVHGRQRGDRCRRRGRGVGATCVKAVYLSTPGDPGDTGLPFSARR